MKSKFTLFAVLTLVLSLCANATAAADNELILVPVQVLGASGQPVSGLKAADFLIQSDGKPQPVSLLIETGNTNATFPTKSDSAGLLFSSVPDGGMPQQLLILALDLVNTGFLGHGEAQQQLLTYLAENLPDRPFELVAVTRDGLLQIHSFSADRTVLQQALLRAADGMDKGALSFDPTASSEYSRLATALRAGPIHDQYAWEIGARASLIALRQLIEAYAGVPGRKSVIWLAAGVRVMGTDPDATSMPGGSFQFQTKSPLKTDPQLRAAYDSALRLLNTTDIAVYPVDLKVMKSGKIYLANPPAGYVPGLDTAMHVVIARGEINDGLRLFAADTGGRPCSITAELKTCVQAIADDSAHYYLVGFYVPAQSRKSGWRKLEITTTSPGSKVRSRTRYFMPTTQEPGDADIRADMMAAAKASISYGGLAFTVERLPDSPRPADDPINVRIRVPADSILMQTGLQKLSYQIATVALSEKGEPVNAVQIVPFNLNAEQSQEAMAKGWRINESWPELSSMTGVRYVIRDNNTGRIGSVTIPLTRQAPTPATAGK